MVFLGLKASEKEPLELEIVSHEARLKLTRIIRSICRSNEPLIKLIRMNQFVNLANTVLDRPIFVLTPDDWGDYHDIEYAWHNSEIELIMRRPSTIELVEILADLIQADVLDSNKVNEILQNDKCSFRFEINDDNNEVGIAIDSLSEIPEEDLTGDHLNIRKLAERMDSEIDRKDPAAVLHTAASIFETLAKDVLSDARLEDQSLGGFFAKYRKTSPLPEPILDYVLDIFQNRNTMPLAAHGSTRTPTITMDDAVVLAELTKATVRAERQIALLETSTRAVRT